MIKQTSVNPSKLNTIRTGYARGVPSKDERLMDEIATFYADPLGYVMFAFPWGEDQLTLVELVEPYASRFNSKYGPDKWACEFLDELGEEIKQRNFDGTHSVDPIKFSTASGHGIGKSTLVAWLIKFILDTRPMSKGVITANTSEQLRTKTWAELAKWNAMSITSHLWHYTSGRGSMSLSRKGPHDISYNWRADAQTCREENAEAFQGLHAASSTPFYIFDEASGIPDKIWEARAGGATDGEPMSFDFGNPTRKSGHFYENTVGKYRHRHITRSIDSRSVSITNNRIFDQWAEDWGEDSDFFKVKVKGEFPSAGSVQFISSDLVSDATRRDGIHTKSDNLLIGVDVARFGDNSTVIYPRIGRDAKSFGFKEYKGLDNVQVAEKVIEMIREFKLLGKICKGLFIDGGGLGGGVVDILRRAGYNPIDVNFGGRSSDPRFSRKVDEMWGRLRDDMQYLSIPKDQNLMDQLTQREYGFSQNGKIALESKSDMINRGVQSPDLVDALALTYATIIAADVDIGLDGFMAIRAITEYDPLDMKF